jgi:hypothetical protein
MPTSLSPTEPHHIAGHIKAIPPGESPATVIGFLSRKYDIAESALTSAITATKSGTVPAPTVTATTPSPIYEAEEMRRAVDFKTEVEATQSRPLSEASTADLYQLTGALIPRR